MSIPRRRSAATLRLRDLDSSHRLDMLAGWSPPTTEAERRQSRWDSWERFLDEYQTLKSQIVECYGLEPGEIFAEKALRYASAFSMESLANASHTAITDPDWDDEEEASDDGVID